MKFIYFANKFHTAERRIGERSWEIPQLRVNQLETVEATKRKRKPYRRRMVCDAIVPTTAEMNGPGHPLERFYVHQ